MVLSVKQIFLFSLLLLYVNAELKVLAFNVQIFGKSKMENATIAAILVRVFRKYDIALIQEIRDSTGEAIHLLLEMINDCSNCPQYGLSLSDPLGRTNSKEQYGYFYRKSIVKILKEHQFPEALDKFERPPYSIKFEWSGVQLAFSGLHTKPTDAVAEIDAYFDVYLRLKKDLGISEIILMGDLNAGCSYVPRYRWPEIRIKTDTTFKWYISDSVDTTVSQKECPYDRFVGKGVSRTVRSQVYRYDLEFKISRALAGKVSDHWPIEMYIYK